jgi:DNA-binding beta-propeller fold protein YncE
MGANGGAICFAPDGLKMYAAKYWDNTVKQYDFTEAYDLSTATYIGSQAFTQGGSPYGIFVSSDGQHMYIAQSNTDSLHRYSQA